MRIARPSLLCAVLVATACRRSTPTIGSDPTTTTSVSTEAPRRPVLVGRVPGEGWGGDFEVPSRVVRVAEHELTVRTSAAIDGRPVDIEVRFTDPADGMMGHVELRPLGAGGDALLTAMAKAWKQPARPRGMRTLRLPAAFLSGSAKAAATDALHTKVFFDDVQSELFVNWNPKTSMLELFEKDEDYREGVIGGLSTP